jgi:hypothetical protein
MVSYDKSEATSGMQFVAIIFISGLFWYFWLTIQNTTSRQVRNLFYLVAVVISFPLLLESVLLWPLGQGSRVSLAQVLFGGGKKKPFGKKKQRKKKKKASSAPGYIHWA